MSIRLKNTNVLPQGDVDTVEILGLELPLRDRLSFGAQVEVIDLQNKYQAGDLGEFEYLMRLFCVFTHALPKPQRVRYEWLAQQHLEAEEVAELTTGTLALLNAISTTVEDGAEGKNAVAGPKGKKNRPSTPSA